MKSRRPKWTVCATVATAVIHRRSGARHRIDSSGTFAFLDRASLAWTSWFVLQGFSLLLGSRGKARQIGCYPTSGYSWTYSCRTIPAPHQKGGRPRKPCRYPRPSRQCFPRPPLVQRVREVFQYCSELQNGGSSV